MSTCRSCTCPLPTPAVKPRRPRLYCDDCKELRKYGRAIARILRRRPSLEAVALEHLGKIRRPVAAPGPRPAWRDKRREFYTDFEQWAQVRAMRARTPGSTLSAVVRYALRVFFSSSMPYERFVVTGDGELLPVADDREEAA